MNVFQDWVIMQGTGSPPSYRAERMESSPWLESKQSVIEWIKDYERQRAVNTAHISIVRATEATGDT